VVLNRSEISSSERQVPTLANVKPIPATDHYDSGSLRFRGANLEGEMHGPWEFFRRDGSLMRSGSFDRGKQVGVWRTYGRSGKVVKETN
jgi:antitoxin component YwqK of YwqJK toxin-antitoxin module